MGKYDDDHARYVARLLLDIKAIEYRVQLYRDTGMDLRWPEMELCNRRNDLAERTAIYEANAEEERAFENALSKLTHEEQDALRRGWKVE